ncbi:hypothetical protein [Bacillus swezeyi]|uniref:hypothetical protein n=1 Tax=Bacillus swezeyi TaxID=1925020 RepID=UPI001CC25444|nr:hypothetical protein [Bacillus swezeyi]
MPKYRKKPVVVEAFRLGFDELPKWFSERIPQICSPFTLDPYSHPEFAIKTRKGSMRADYGDYIIKGVEGEIYPCKPEIFEKTYDSVDVSKKAREMAELSEMVTKSGINFSEKGASKPLVPYVVSAQGLYTKILVSWTYDPDMAFYEVYGSQTQGFEPSYSTLLFMDKAKTNAFVHEIEVNQEWYYRVRGIDKNGRVSNFTGEVSAETSKIGDIGGDKMTIKAGTISAEDIEKYESKTSNIGKIPVIINVDPKEVAKACWGEFQKQMQKQNARSK